MVSYKLVPNSWVMFFVPRRFDAMTIGTYIHLRDEEVSTRLLIHEICHVMQYNRLGFFGFLFRYFWYQIRHGYYDNPLEREAREFAAEKYNEGWRPE